MLIADPWPKFRVTVFVNMRGTDILFLCETLLLSPRRRESRRFAVASDMSRSMRRKFFLTKVTTPLLIANSNARCWAMLVTSSRPNLRIVTRAVALGVEMEDRRATGVRYRGPEGETVIRARREVILCGGSINSPHLLMLSGIGDAGHLSEHGIKPVHHLPGVGRNLQDHLQARPVWRCTVPTMNDEVQSLLQKARIAAQYALTRRGPMTMAASLGVAFLRTPDDLETPDIQFHIQPWSAEKPGEGPHAFSAFTASVCQLRPESRGHIALAGPDPAAYPKLPPNYLATQPDCDTVVAGLKIARRIVAHAPLAGMIKREEKPGAEVTDEALLSWARDTAVSIYHPTGTCKMGTGPDAVVGPDLRVHGAEGLRVADASIMPEIVSGNTNAPAIMIGEKAADLVLGEARVR